MASIDLSLDGRELRVRFDRLVMAGYTGRNQAEVRAHIDELRSHGIPAPAQVPTLYACTPGLLTTAETITVLGGDTSGEAEFVVIPHDGVLLIGAGSDHTDRVLEATDIPRAKQLCAKVVSREVWRFAEVADHWDELILRSWIGAPGREEPYQEGPLARMLAPEAILDYVRAHTTAPMEGTIVFSGTLAASGGFRAAPRFRAELEDPRRGRTLTCAYQIDVMDYVTP